MTVERTLEPLHWSYRQLLATGARIKPLNMDRIKVGQEMSDGLTKIALSIFTDASNAGVPFQDALLAIYLSGLEHAVSAIRSDRKRCNE